MPSWPVLPPWRQGCLICLWISRTTTAFIFYLTLNWLQFYLTSLWQTGNWDNPGADLWVNQRYLPWGQLCLSVGWESWVGVVKSATDWFIFGTSCLLRALRGGISSLMTLLPSIFPLCSSFLYLPHSYGSYSTWSRSLWLEHFLVCEVFNTFWLLKTENNLSVM